MKKQLITAGIAAAVGVTGLAGIATVSAATDSSTGSGPMSSLVTAIASKFNLDKTKVQAVFDEQRSQMDAQRETQVKAEVTQLVKDGKLTQAQADAINAKRAELTKEREANRAADQSASRDDMKTKMDAKRTELEAWAKEQGIDTQYLRLVMGGGRGHGGPDGMPGDRDGDDSAATTSTSSSSSSTN